MWPTNGYNQFNKSMNNEKRTILPKVLLWLSTLLILDLFMPKLSVARGNSVHFAVWICCPTLPNFWVSISAHLVTRYSSLYILWMWCWGGFKKTSENRLGSLATRARFYRLLFSTRRTDICRVLYKSVQNCGVANRSALTNFLSSCTVKHFRYSSMFAFKNMYITITKISI